VSTAVLFKTVPYITKEERIPMTKKIFWLLALGAQLLFVSAGCEEEVEEETEEADEAAEEATEEAEEAEEAAEEAGEEAAEAAEANEEAGGGGVCDRAQRCCEAYITEMNSHMPAGAPQMTAEQSCAGIAQARTLGAAGDTTCNQQIAAFRQGLTAAQHNVPGDCAE
jgi:hypothetical protein